MKEIPPSPEVNVHEAKVAWIDACIAFREAAGQLSHPLARKLMLEMADELDAEAAEVIANS